MNNPQYVVPYVISGPELVDIMRSAYSADSTSVSEFALCLYSDASGLDAETSFILYETKAKRILTHEDVMRVLNGLPSTPLGYSVREWAADAERVFYLDKYSDEEISIDMKDVEVVHFAAVLDNHFVGDAEVIRFIRELVSYDDGLPVDTQGALWQGIDSPGRMLLRRIREAGRFAELTDFLIVDEELGWGSPRRPTKDYRRFCLATAMVRELYGSDIQPPEEVVQALLGARSPLNDFWKVRLRAVLRGDPIWMDDEKYHSEQEKLRKVTKDKKSTAD